MTAPSVLSPEQRSIVDRFLARALHGRNESLRYDIQRRESEHTRRGVADQAYYRREQETACVNDFEERLHAVWASYQRVIIEAALPWTTELRAEIDKRIDDMAQDNRSYIEELVRDPITRHGHGFSLFLLESIQPLRNSLDAEIDLFAMKYLALGATLLNALQAPRYSGPLMHWTAARAAIRRTPSEGLRAANEAIQTVEAIARIICGKPTHTLGDCLKALKASGRINGAAARGIETLWGYTSNSPGVRHGAITRVELPMAEAEYIIESAEAAGKLLLSVDAPAN